MTEGTIDQVIIKPKKELTNHFLTKKVLQRWMCLSDDQSGGKKTKQTN